jgi:hypothetical protein
MFLQKTQRSTALQSILILTFRACSVVRLKTLLTSLSVFAVLCVKSIIGATKLLIAHDWQLLSQAALVKGPLLL